MSAVAKRWLPMWACAPPASTRTQERSTLERRTTWNVTMERRLESEMRGSPCLDAARMKRIWPTTYSVKTGGTSG